MFYKKIISLVVICFFFLSSFLPSLAFATDEHSKQVKEYHKKIEHQVLKLKEKFPELNIDILDNADGLVRIALLENAFITINAEGSIKTFHGDLQTGEINILEDFREAFDNLVKKDLPDSEKSASVGKIIDKKLNEKINPQKGNNDVVLIYDSNLDKENKAEKSFEEKDNAQESIKNTELERKNKEIALYEQEKEIIKLVIKTSTCIFFTSLAIFILPGVNKSLGKIVNKIKISNKSITKPKSTALIKEIAIKATLVAAAAYLIAKYYEGSTEDQLYKAINEYRKLEKNLE